MTVDLRRPSDPASPSEHSAGAVFGLNPQERIEQRRLDGSREPVRGAGPLVLLRNAWRTLTTMRTALLLLFLLTVAAVPGSLLPQQRLGSNEVALFYLAHPHLAPWLNRFYLFGVFSSPWFSAIYLLLFVSLLGCLARRVPAHLRGQFAKPPITPSRLERLPVSASWQTRMSADEAVKAARSRLRRRGWRTGRYGDSSAPSVAAEAGQSRETGNLLFHFALLALLVGAGLGSFYGYTGNLVVVSGHGFTNAVSAYDEFSAGPRVKAEGLTPFTVRLDSFDASYQPGGQPKSFDAHVTYRGAPAAPERSYDIRVNHPLTLGSSRVYLLNHGFAPHIVVRDRVGAVVFDDDVVCRPDGGPGASGACTIKVPDLPGTTQQLGFTGFVFPTLGLDPARGAVSTDPQPRNPGMTLLAYAGDLGLDSGVPQSVYALNTTHLARISVAGPSGRQPAQLLRINDPNARTITGLPGGFSLTVDRVDQWTALTVKRDPAKRLVLGAAIAMVAGLLLSLRVRRRRVWLRATGVPGGLTLVAVGGLARSDADGFHEQWPSLVARLKTAVPPAPGRDPLPTKPAAGPRPAPARTVEG